MEWNILFVGIATYVLFLIVSRFRKNNAVLRKYQIELQEVLNNDENKAKGRFD